MLMCLPALVVISVLIFDGLFTSWSTCGRCGAIKRTTAWQIPFIRPVVTVAEMSSFEPTALSQAVDELRLATSHKHAWIFISGGGNGVCMLGRGSSLSGVYRSESAAGFLRDVFRHDGDGAARSWLAKLLDPELRALDLLYYPVEGSLGKTGYTQHRDALLSDIALRQQLGS